MSRSTRGSKELNNEQRLKLENIKLKRQISALRKQLSRIDVDRYQELRLLIDRQEAEDHAEEYKEVLEKVAKMWECWDCRDKGEHGILQIHTIERRDGLFYWRQCDSCPKRTKGQRHDGSPKEGVYADEQAMESSKRHENSKT